MAEENAIRRRICVVSRIRDAGYGLVAHRSLAVAAMGALAIFAPAHRLVRCALDFMHRTPLTIDAWEASTRTRFGSTLTISGERDALGSL